MAELGRHKLRKLTHEIPPFIIKNATETTPALTSISILQNYAERSGCLPPQYLFWRLFWKLQDVFIVYKWAAIVLVQGKYRFISGFHQSKLDAKTHAADIAVTWYHSSSLYPPEHTNNYDGKRVGVPLLGSPCNFDMEFDWSIPILKGVRDKSWEEWRNADMKFRDFFTSDPRKKSCRKSRSKAKAGLSPSTSSSTMNHIPTAITETTTGALETTSVPAPPWLGVPSERYSDLKSTLARLQYAAGTNTIPTIFDSDTGGKSEEGTLIQQQIPSAAEQFTNQLLTKFKTLGPAVLISELRQFSELLNKGIAKQISSMDARDNIASEIVQAYAKGYGDHSIGGESRMWDRTAKFFRPDRGQTSNETDHERLKVLSSKAPVPKIARSESTVVLTQNVTQVGEAVQPRTFMQMQTNQTSAMDYEHTVTESVAQVWSGGGTPAQNANGMNTSSIDLTGTANSMHNTTSTNSQASSSFTALQRSRTIMDLDSSDSEDDDVNMTTDEISVATNTTKSSFTPAQWATLKGRSGLSEKNSASTDGTNGEETSSKDPDDDTEAMSSGSDDDDEDLAREERSSGEDDDGEGEEDESEEDDEDDGNMDDDEDSDEEDDGGGSGGYGAAVLSSTGDFATPADIGSSPRNSMTGSSNVDRSQHFDQLSDDSSSDLSDPPEGFDEEEEDSVVDDMTENGAVDGQQDTQQGDNQVDEQESESGSELDVTTATEYNEDEEGDQDEEVEDEEDYGDETGLGYDEFDGRPSSDDYAPPPAPPPVDESQDRGDHEDDFASQFSSLGLQHDHGNSDGENEQDGEEHEDDEINIARQFLSLDAHQEGGGESFGSTQAGTDDSESAASTPATEVTHLEMSLEFNNDRELDLPSDESESESGEEGEEESEAESEEESEEENAEESEAESEEKDEDVDDLTSGVESMSTESK